MNIILLHINTYDDILIMQKTNTHIDHLDVRSLRILKYLLESKSVSRTADYIGLSQPSTSRIIARLRLMIKDPLLIRLDNGYGLTAYAQQLYPKLSVALEAMNAVLEADEFDPRNVKATLRIASTDYGLVCVLKKLYPILLDQSPGINLEVRNFTPQVFSSIQHGEIDLALYANFNLPGDFHCRKLFDENYSLLLRSKHPLTDQYNKNKSVDTSQLNEWPQAEMQYPSMSIMQNDNVINISPVTDESNTRFRSPYFFAVAALIEDTDTIAALPTRICQQAEKHYAVTSLPLTDSEGFTYVVIWHHRQHQRPLVRWIVNQFADLFPSYAL